VSGKTEAVLKVIEGKKEVPCCSWLGPFASWKKSLRENKHSWGKKEIPRINTGRGEGRGYWKRNGQPMEE